MAIIFSILLLVNTYLDLPRNITDILCDLVRWTTMIFHLSPLSTKIQSSQLRNDTSLRWHSIKQRLDTSSCICLEKVSWLAQEKQSNQGQQAQRLLQSIFNLVFTDFFEERCNQLWCYCNYFEELSFQVALFTTYNLLRYVVFCKAIFDVEYSNMSHAATLCCFYCYCCWY